MGMIPTMDGGSSGKQLGTVQHLFDVILQPLFLWMMSGWLSTRGQQRNPLWNSKDDIFNVWAVKVPSFAPNMPLPLSLLPTRSLTAAAMGLISHDPKKSGG
jgi:hypothetical protein